MFPNEESILTEEERVSGCSLKSFFVLKAAITKHSAGKGSSILPIPATKDKDNAKEGKVGMDAKA